MATQPKSKEQIQAQIKALREWEIEHTVGVVDPMGDVTEHVCGPPDEGEDGPKSGDTFLRWINGAPRIVKKYEDLGYELYEKIAKADGTPEVYTAWKAAVSARKRGYPIRGNVDDLYSATVLRLKSLAAAGGAKHGQAFVIGQGIAADPEAKKNKIAEHMKSLGIGDPRVDPEPEPKSKGGKAAAHAT